VGGGCVGQVNRATRTPVHADSTAKRDAAAAQRLWSWLQEKGATSKGAKLTAGAVEGLAIFADRYPPYPQLWPVTHTSCGAVSWGLWRLNGSTAVPFPILHRSPTGWFAADAPRIAQAGCRAILSRRKP
jgi:hypothetical protein